MMYQAVNLSLLKEKRAFTISEVTDLGPAIKKCDEYPPGHPCRYMHMVEVNGEVFFAIKLNDVYYEVNVSDTTSLWKPLEEHSLYVQTWILHIYKKKAGLFWHPDRKCFFSYPRTPISEIRIVSNEGLEFDAEAYANAQAEMLDEYNDPEQYVEKYLPHVTANNFAGYLHVRKFYPQHAPSEAHFSTVKLSFAQGRQNAC